MDIGFTVILREVKEVRDEIKAMSKNIDTLVHSLGDKSKDVEVMRDALRDIAYGVLEDSGGVTQWGAPIDVTRMLSRIEMIQIATDALELTKSSKE